jgi:hypothetical protein
MKIYSPLLNPLPEPSQGFKAVQGLEWLVRERFESMGDSFLVQGFKARNPFSENSLPTLHCPHPLPLSHPMGEGNRGRRGRKAGAGDFASVSIREIRG